jgi:hypothetical protein
MELCGSCQPHVFERKPHASVTTLDRPLKAVKKNVRTSLWGKKSKLPALRTSRLSRLDLNVNHALACSQSSLPQQQDPLNGGSGDGNREKLAKATVRSSMVVVARWRLFASGDSGVFGRVSPPSCMTT